MEEDPGLGFALKASDKKKSAAWAIAACVIRKLSENPGAYLHKRDVPRMDVFVHSLLTSTSMRGSIL